MRKLIVGIGTVLLLLLIFTAAFFLLAKDAAAASVQQLEAAGFSGAILLANGDTVTLAEGYGAASCDGTIANSADTVFAIGSVTKMFTATAIAQLDEAGKLNIDEPIGNYFSDVPADKASITVRQLLDHTAGLQTYHETQRLGDFEAMSADKALTEILSRPLLSPPGNKENYSNSGYTLLALLIEQASGQTYVDYVREHILEPASMNRTGFWGESFDNMAATPNQILGCSTPDKWDYSYVIVGNGGMVSTVEDMHKWVLALKGDAVLSDSAKQRIGYDRVLEIGFSDAGGSSQHEFNASINYIAPTDTVVVVISNRNSVRAEEAAGSLVLAMLQERFSLR